MEHALVPTAIHEQDPTVLPRRELDETEDGSPAPTPTRHGPQRWIERPYPKMS